MTYVQTQLLPTLRKDDVVICDDLNVHNNKQALSAPQPDHEDTLIHHADRGSQYVSIRYEPNVWPKLASNPQLAAGEVAHDNALTEAINALVQG